jgi:hypothetical protein
LHSSAALCWRTTQAATSCCYCINPISDMRDQLLRCCICLHPVR